jgi:pyrroline-5-carboxylate reductase
VMTNTPSAIARAATGIAPGRRSTREDAARLRDIFSTIGVAVEISEHEIDAVTALAGSGPAFLYTVVEALAAGAGNVGLRSDAALRLAAQTALGAAELILSTGKSPEELRNMVVTPGGTTAAGLQAMNEHATAAGLAAAVEAATERGREMAAEFGG